VRGERKKKKCCICSLKRLPHKRRLAIVFFPPALPTRCVCFTIICSIIYIRTKSLQCYYREIESEIVNMQVYLRNVQGLEIDNLGPPVSLP
jgi:hypothetical protein